MSGGDPKYNSTEESRQYEQTEIPCPLTLALSPEAGERENSGTAPFPEAGAREEFVLLFTLNCTKCSSCIKENVQMFEGCHRIAVQSHLSICISWILS
jgi:hypothetical protein